MSGGFDENLSSQDEFDQAASGQQQGDHDRELGQSGEGSEMVQNDQPGPQPRPSWAAEQDRNAHNQQLNEERARAAQDHQREKEQESERLRETFNRAAREEAEQDQEQDEGMSW